ncbi:uncharacterized protein LOC119270179 isoform X2 [Triticum dicoccoides]|uniref:uncharacterized protein LOC119270179 isoform X2 n=1 Tax=Triticum dicoccoides TaxID=85692 RepID=UPI000E78F709|nr:uncharacterized protein LOC119270179 isoform X2 [Triticum dicoccoides]
MLLAWFQSHLCCRQADQRQSSRAGQLTGEAQVMEKLPTGTCDAMVGLGCCFIDIQVNLRAFTLDISRINGTPHSKQVQAYISDNMDPSFTPIGAYSGSQYSGTAQLDWSIPYQPNCRRAMEDKDSYACVSNQSECYDSPIGGYVRYCQSGAGNPYVYGGCIKELYGLYGSMQPRKDCPTSCGDVSIPFPFGTDLGCFAKPHLHLACTPPVLKMTARKFVTDISIDDGILQVQELLEPDDSGSNSDPTLYISSVQSGMVKWAIDFMPCEDAMNESDYRCVSTHCGCIDVTDDRTLKHVGYRCKCSPGFEGNPYLQDGCTDTDECRQPDKCKGICQNTFGSYTCTSCPHGTDFNSATGKCKPTTIILEPVQLLLVGYEGEAPRGDSGRSDPR